LKSRAHTAALAALALCWFVALWHQERPSVAASEAGIGAAGGAADSARARVHERLLATLAELSAGVRHHSEAHHAAALEALELRLVAAGHEPLRQNARHLSVPVVNLLARANGTQSTGLVVVMGHHDSVFGSPGASDDGAGAVAALEAFLEVARTPHRNDILLLLTDGEELGLHGARSFVAEHRWFGEVRAALNLESLGNAGPAWLFETGPTDARWIAGFARSAPLPIGSSVAEPIYRTLMSHRDTDFSPFRDAGIGGLNFAIVWGTSANHRPFDTYTNIDKSSVVHLFESGRAALDVLANADLAAPRASKPAFFELPLIGMVVVAPWASRALSFLALAAALLATYRATCAARHAATGEGGVRRAALGFAVGLAALAAALGAAVLAARGAAALADVLPLEHTAVGNARSMRWFAVGSACVSAGVFGALAGAARFSRAWFLVPWAVALVALEWKFPLAAHQAALPLFAGACAVLADGRARPLAVVFVALAALFLGPMLRTLPQIVSGDPTFAALAGALPAAALAALALAAARDARHTKDGGALIAVGLIAFVVSAAIAATGA
jgi:hypothetical protein